MAAAGHLATTEHSSATAEGPPIHTKISITDGASIFRKPTPKHLHPYDMAVRKFGNSIIKIWGDEIAPKLPGKKGEIDQADLSISMSSVYQKKTIDKAMTVIDLIPEPTDEQVKRICIFLKDTPVEELVTYGHTLIVEMFEVLKIKMIIQNFKKVSEVTELDEDLFESHRKLASMPDSAKARIGNGNLTEEDFEDITKKISSMINRDNIFGPNPIGGFGR